jgi:hypothetical protein
VDFVAPEPAHGPCRSRTHSPSMLRVPSRRLTQ